MQEVLSAHPEIVGQSLTHEHAHGHHHSGHHHGIDMDHPILALNMTIVSICIKEGYQSYLYLLICGTISFSFFFILLKYISFHLGFFLKLL